MNLLALKTFGLFLLTAAAELTGCYLVYLWRFQHRPMWWLMPAGLSLALFAWLLTLHPTLPAGRAYAAYGGVYVVAALVWLWVVQGIQPDWWDGVGAMFMIVGMVIVAFAPH